MKFQPLFLPTRLKLLPTRSHLGVPLGNEHRTVPRFTANEWNNFLPIGKLTFLPTEISGFLFSKWKAPINAKLIRVGENLYKTASSVYFNGGIGDWFRTTVGVKQRCLLSKPPIKTFLGRILSDALEDH